MFISGLILSTSYAVCLLFPMLITSCGDESLILTSITLEIQVPCTVIGWCQCCLLEDKILWHHICMSHKISMWKKTELSSLVRQTTISKLFICT